MIVKNDCLETGKNYKYMIVATDRFMSGWGMASKRASKCAWAIPSDFPASAVDMMEKWVSNRSEMKYVNVVRYSSYRPKNCAHFHIYAVDKNHPALSGLFPEEGNEH